MGRSFDFEVEVLLPPKEVVEEINWLKYKSYCPPLKTNDPRKFYVNLLS
jgi:hypothetical protein